MLQPVILAAGKGTRMRSETPKALYQFEGQPLVQWVIEAVKKVPGTRSPILVVGHESVRVREEIGPECTYVEQKEINGTGAAVRCALPHVQKGDNVLVLYSDQPLVQPKSIEKIKRAIDSEPNALVMGTVILGNFEGWRETLAHFGRVVRDSSGSVVRIVENKDASDSERAITEVNPSVFCASAEWLTDAIARIKQSPVSDEYYLTDIAEIAVRDRKKIVTVDLSPEETFGINSQEDAVRASEALKRLKSVA